MEPTKKIVSKGNEINFNRYIKDISKYPVLSAAEEKRLFKLYYKTGDGKILEKICKHNLLFVIKVARHYAGKLTESTILVLEDLISEGNIGLYTAAKNFDYTKDLRFLTYAEWHIRQAIIKLIQDNIRLIRLPVYTRKYVADFNKRKSELDQENFNEVSDLEVLNKLPLKSSKNVSMVEHAVKMSDSQRSLDSLVNTRTNNKITDVVPDGNILLPDEDIINSQREKLIFEIINSIDKESFKYISDFFGLSGKKPLNYCEIGRKYNMSSFVVKNKMTKAINQLKDKNKKRIFFY